MKADIGLIGLAVMGQNLVLNIVDNGYRVAVYNRTTEKVDEFVSSSGTDAIIGAHSLKELVESLKRPRVIMLMVKAGQPVDKVISGLIPLLEEGDLIVDGGNSNYRDTMRRTEELSSHGLLFLGVGVSGGEEGARHGPSLMPGGSKEGWAIVKDLFQSIAAKVEDGSPCCEWVGPGGAGHYVKMVHNGIEYGDMQLIAEAFHFMYQALGMSMEEIASTFQKWNSGRLESYLIEITAKILTVQDEDGEPLVTKILDKAGQKGTGKWTAISALELGVPLTLIGDAVFQRFISSLKSERVRAEQIYNVSRDRVEGDRSQYLPMLESALYASKIISYSQGFALMQRASEEFAWSLNFGDIALMWRGGCIIRSIFLGKIKEAYSENPELTNLLVDPFFSSQLKEALPSWRTIVATGIRLGVPLPGMAAALSYFDSYTSSVLPANLIQAQRDYFGAHTYLRIDDENGTPRHTEWSRL